MQGKRYWLVLMAVASTLMLATSVGADSGTEAEFVAEINATRSAQGLEALQLESGLRSHARSHTLNMIEAGRLFHSSSAELTAAATEGWQRIGENVGRGQSPTSLHNAFMESPGHRGNILGDYNYVGVGTGTSNGYLYVTVVFMKADPFLGSIVSDRPGVNGSIPCPPGATCDTVAFQDAGGRFEVWDHLASTGDVSSFFYGNPGDVAFGGDWDCDGVETLGLYRRSDGYVYLTNSTTGGLADITYYFGNPGDIPIAGDFNGDGCDTVSIYRPGEARSYIINSLGGGDRGLGAADHSFVFGVEGDTPFAGDFDGDGIDTIGLHRGSTGLIYFRNSHGSGLADGQFRFGDPGDILVAGDWDGDGDDTVAVYRPSDGMLHVKNTNGGGAADASLFVGGYSGLVALQP
ncbi:MAG TPA: CAP domain-containing protein [Acidimicrobiia bacterium]|nr:CAP domain-containing protein [Acidimicrobiia bacterium]